jgi:hypothetical protein
MMNELSVRNARNRGNITSRLECARAWERMEYMGTFEVEPQQ